MRDVRVISKPTRRVALSERVDLQDGPDLQPTEETVKTRMSLDVAPPLHGELDEPEPAKEQDQVADSDTLVREMCLRRTHLSKRREPYWSADARTWLSLRKLQEHMITALSRGYWGAWRAPPESADPGFR